MNTIKKIKVFTLLGESVAKVLNIDHTQIDQYLPDIISFLENNREKFNNPEVFAKGESIMKVWAAEKHK